MTREQRRSLRAMIDHYRRARSQQARFMVGGVEVLKDSSTRWDLINAQHTLAEFVADLEIEP